MGIVHPLGCPLVLVEDEPFCVVVDVEDEPPCVVVDEVGVLGLGALTAIRGNPAA